MRQQRRLPLLAFLRATNESGDVIYGPGVPFPPINISDRDYFVRLRADPNAGLFISRALMARIDKKWIWLFARRISKPDGSFGGVTYAAIYLDDLDQMLARISLRVGGVATLRDADVGVLARHGSHGMNPAPPGDRKIAVPFANALKANPNEGTYVSGGTSIDNISRTQSYRRSAKYGYYVNVGISSSEAIAVWRHQAMFVAGLVVIFTVVTITSVRQIRRSWLRQEEDMEALRANVKERTRLIVDLESSNADLEQFAYVSSHDLRTPLRNIISYSQLLEHRYKGRIDDDADIFIGFIVDNGRQMTRLINDLLEYSRITSQSKPLQPTLAVEAVAQALSNLRLELNESSAEVTVENLPQVMADETHLVSLFQNLLSNGLKYRASGRKPRLSVTAERVAPDLWRFAVADNGIGIEPQYQEKVFDIFQRLAPTSDKQGTGIGLTLCRRIVRRFGGTIWLDSKPGVGTTVFFTLKDCSATT